MNHLHKSWLVFKDSSGNRTQTNRENYQDKENFFPGITYEIYNRSREWLICEQDWRDRFQFFF